MKRFFKWFAIILLVLIGGVVALLSSIDINDQRDTITAELSKELGREVQIKSGLDLQIGLSPSVEIKGLTLANPDWASRPNLLEAGRAAVSLKLIPLLSKKIEIDSIELADVTIKLERQADGQANWELQAGADSEDAQEETQQPSSVPDAAPTDGDKPKGKAAGLPDIARISLSNVEIIIDDKQAGLTEQLTIATGEINARREAPLAVKMQARLRDQPITLDITGGRLAALVKAKDTWPLKGDVGVAGARLTLDGKLTGLAGKAAGFEGAASLKIEDGVKLAQAIKPYSAEGAAVLTRLSRASLSTTATKTAFTNITVEALLAGITLKADSKDGIELAGGKPQGKLGLRITADELGQIKPLLTQLAPDLALPLDPAEVKAVNITGEIDIAGKDEVALRDLKASLKALGLELGATGRITSLTKGAVLFVDATGKGETLAGLKPLAGDALPDDARLWQSGPVKAKASLRGLATAPRISDIDVDFAGNGTKLAITGDFEMGQSADLRVNLTAPSLKRVAALAGADAPALGPLSLKTRITGKPLEMITLGGLTLSLAEQDIAGDITITTSGKRPSIKGALQGGAITLSKLTGEAAETSAKPGGSKGTNSTGPSNKDHVLPDFDLPLDALKALDLDLKLAVKSLDLDDLTLKGIDTRARITNGALAVKPLSLSLNGRPITGQIGMDGGLSVDLTASDLNYGKLLRQLDVTDLVKGRADLALTLNGKGKSFREVLGSAGGNFKLVSGKGEVRTSLLNKLTAGLLMALFPNDKDGVTVVNCVVTDFAISGGVARSKAIVLDTERLTMTADGKITLAPEKLDLTAQQQPSASGLRLPASARITGTMGNPKVSLDAAGAVKDIGKSLIGNQLGALLGTGSTGKASAAKDAPTSDCAAALGKKAAARADDAKPAQQQPANLKEAGEQLKDNLKDAVPRIKKDDLEGIGKGLLQQFGR